MKKPSALGANIFAGGFTLGVSKYFNVIGHLEHDDYGVEVAKANFPRLPVFTGTDTWPKELPPGSSLDFLYSNPPCAVWSLAGNRIGRNWTKDPRLQRVRDVFELVERYRPKVWCWESVCQAFERGRPFVEELAAAAVKLGYAVTYLLVDAQYLNAPQTRKRFFLVLHRVVIDWDKARPTFQPGPTVGDALRGVKPQKHLMSRFANTDIGKQMVELIDQTPPGGRVSATYERLITDQRRSESGKLVGKPSFLAYRIDPAKKAGVVFGDKTFHHREPRHLAVNELGALHGFPPDWNWVNEKHRLTVQRGVLPPVAEWLARNVAKAVKMNVPARAGDRTLVDYRTPPGAIQGGLSALPAGVDLNWRPGRGEPGPKPAPEAGQGARKRALAPPKPAGPGARTRTGGVESLGGRKNNPTKIVGNTPRPSRSRSGGLTSGEFIRARLLERRYADEEIVALVLKNFEGRKTTAADVAWNRRKIAIDGRPKLERIVR
jgi:site-specific DNA-cytosine methylase